VAYEILIQELAAEEIGSLRPFEQRRVMDEIEEQLTNEPNTASRRRKCLVGLKPLFEHILPVWELRIGELRVFYDVDESRGKFVYIRAVRRKKPRQQTKDIT
jgi:mRNA-degrading endonuclease RelE of RelBE toxin-antitoxin system